MSKMDLVRAAEVGDLDSIRRFDEKHDLHAHGSSAVDAAAFAGQRDALALLVELGALGPENELEGGNPLHYEAMTPAIVSLLIQCGCDPNGASWEGQRGLALPLTNALERNRLEVACALLEGGADPNIEVIVVDGTRHPVGTTSHPDGVPWAHLDSVAAVNLLHEYGARFEFSEPSRFTESDNGVPLFRDAAVTSLLRNHEAVFRRLLDLGHCGRPEQRGLSLALALAHGHPAAERALRESGARPDESHMKLALRSLFGTLWTKQPTKDEFRKGVQLLKKEGAQLDDELLSSLSHDEDRARLSAAYNGPSSLEEAIDAGDFDGYSVFVEEAEINPPLKGPAYLRSSQVPTPLWLAVIAGDDRIAADLVRRGARPQSKRDRSRELAERKNMAETVRLMDDMAFDAQLVPPGRIPS